MATDKDLKNAKTVISKERKAIYEIEKRFDDDKFKNNFNRAIDLIFGCKGKVIISGIGKSGIIAQKIAATFNSTGTHSTFLHPAESIHGDIGIIEKNDVALLISKSGESDEIKNLIPYLKHLNIKIILITGNLKSGLGRYANVILDASVKEEACPHNLAPTSSSTVTLALGDALAVSILQKKGFTREDFAHLHPGGLLGKKLLLKVEDIMVKGKNIPTVKPDTNLKDIIYQISSKRLGCTVVTGNNRILGFIADGDIRRLLETTDDIKDIKAKSFMNKNPKLIHSNILAKTALEIMEKNKITQLVISDKFKNLKGILHLHQLVELGL